MTNSKEDSISGILRSIGPGAWSAVQGERVLRGGGGGGAPDREQGAPREGTAQSCSAIPLEFRYSIPLGANQVNYRETSHSKTFRTGGFFFLSL